MSEFRHTVAETKDLSDDEEDSVMDIRRRRYHRLTCGLLVRCLLRFPWQSKRLEVYLPHYYR